MSSAAEKERPLVSVVIIFLNAARFIEDAIQSVFEQTWDDWELLLVDDGSTDQSAAVARFYATEHPGRVRYLEHPERANLGKAISRNVGIQNAKGSIVAFLDADDAWLPHKLTRQVAMFQGFPAAALVYGTAEYWYSWSSVANGHADFVEPLGTGAAVLLPPPRMILEFFLQQTAANPGPSNFAVRREVAIDVGGFDDTFSGIHDVYEDQAFLAKVCLSSAVVAMDECLYRYRQHPEASTALARSGRREYQVRLYFINWLAGYLRRNRFFDRRIWIALRREQLRCWFPVAVERLAGALGRARQGS